MILKIGFMQGRLVPSEKKNFIQSFPWKNWKKEFLIAKENNLKIIEWTIDNYNFEKNPIISKDKIKIIKSLSKKCNLKIESVTCDFYMERPITQCQSFYLKKRVFNKVLKIINSCRIHKIKNIIIPLVDNSSLENKNEENKTLEFFKKFDKLLEQSNIKILFEIDYSPKKVLNFINNFNNNFGINYDTGNSASLGFKLNEEKIYFKRVKNIHIKDRIYKGNTVKLGNGNCNFPELFKFLNKIKYKDNLILQSAKTWKNNEIGEILDNIKFIKKFIR